MNCKNSSLRGFSLLLAALCWLSLVQATPADTADRAAQPITKRKNESTVGDGETSARSTGAGSGAAGFATTSGALVVVVALIVLTAKFARSRGLSGPASLPTDAVQVLGKKLVDYRNTIHLVRCGSRLLVLGASQAGLTTLAEITDPAEVDDLVRLCGDSGKASDEGNLGRLLQRFRSDPTTSESMIEESDPALLRLRERLTAHSVESDSPADIHPLREDAG
jgi:flagellar biogenesis protein FliO